MKPLRTWATAALVAGMAAWSGPATAQEGGPVPLPQAPFPDWMDKATVGPGRPAANGPGGLVEPVEPIDPDPDPAGGRMKPVQGPNSQSRFRFTPPKMPDLSQMRQKATRMSLQRTASGTETTELETFDCTNLDGERREIARLEAALMVLPVGPLREAVTARLAEQKRRVAAAEELATLLPSAATAPNAAVPGATAGGAPTTGTPAGTPASTPAGTPSPAAPVQAAGAPGPALLTATAPPALSPAQRRRVDDLRRILWAQPQAPLPPLPPPAPAVPAPTGKVRIPAQFYRPEGRKSFFQERREEMAAGSEEGSDPPAGDASEDEPADNLQEDQGGPRPLAVTPVTGPTEPASSPIGEGTPLTIGIASPATGTDQPPGALPAQDPGSTSPTAGSDSPPSPPEPMPLRASTAPTGGTAAIPPGAPPDTATSTSHDWPASPSPSSVPAPEAGE